jgi:hypothetical protein
MSNDSPQNPSKENSPYGPSMDQELRSSLEQITSALRGLKFGSVNVIVQDGVVVQVDRTEKFRIRRASN